MRAGTAGILISAMKRTNTTAKNEIDAQNDRKNGDDPEGVVDEFLGGGLRASQLTEMRQALEARLRDAREGRDAVPDDDPRRVALDRKVKELREQVAALAQEEAVNQFVEDSVRATLAKPRRPGTFDGFGDEDENGY